MSAEAKSKSLPSHSLLSRWASEVTIERVHDYISSKEEITNFVSLLPAVVRVLNSNSPRTQEFTFFKTIGLIWCTNKLETGCNCGTVQEISAVIERFQKEVYETNFLNIETLLCTETWDAEGAKTDPMGWAIMGQQTARAYMVLDWSNKQGEPLSVEVIKNAHKVLMSGALCDCGEFRTTSAMAGDYMFDNPSDVASSMVELLRKHEELVHLNNRHPVEVAVDLMLGFVTIHPFSNGNGRMGRLLFSYALQRLGFPFPVVLDSGLSKSYRHYIDALKRAQGRGQKGPLLQLAVLSIKATVWNYARYSKNTTLEELLTAGNIERKESAVDVCTTP